MIGGCCRLQVRAADAAAVVAVASANVAVV